MMEVYETGKDLGMRVNVLKINDIKMWKEQAGCDGSGTENRENENLCRTYTHMKCTVCRANNCLLYTSRCV